MPGAQVGGFDQVREPRDDLGDVDPIAARCAAVPDGSGLLLIVRRQLACAADAEDVADNWAENGRRP
ncbi:hypothetical protein AB4305_08225 [Nocardia sp. 2YAB30]|uniref:hypothetical protein n=1 Tax=unclassified Nocardia TaxID=2637762 RepID=UPI003F9CCE89